MFRVRLGHRRLAGRSYMGLAASNGFTVPAGSLRTGGPVMRVDHQPCGRSSPRRCGSGPVFPGGRRGALVAPTGAKDSTSRSADVAALQPTALIRLPATRERELADAYSPPCLERVVAVHSPVVLMTVIRTSCRAGTTFVFRCCLFAQLLPSMVTFKTRFRHAGETYTG